MRIFVMFSILALGLVSASGCKKADEAKEDAKEAVDEAAEGAKKATDAVKEAADDAADEVKGASKEAYVKAAVEIGCLGMTEKDATKVAEKSMDIQKKLGFDAKTWAEWAQKMAQDPEVTKQVADGLANCAK